MERGWYLIAYDVRDPRRLSQTARTLKGFGERVQFSVFRVRASKRQIERLKWELSRILRDEDCLLVVRICGACVQNIYQKGSRSWETDSPSVVIV